MQVPVARPRGREADAFRILRDRKLRASGVPVARTIEYVGHATVFVDLDGVRLLTDPLLRNRVAHLRRSTPVAARTRRGVDAVLISHAHYDHLDLPSLEKLGKTIPIVVPRGLGGLLRKRRFESVIEVEVGETLAIGELQIRAVQAEHDGSRSPIGVSADPVGYVVSGSKSVYFAGDTDLFDAMGELGPVDVGPHPHLGLGAESRRWRPPRPDASSRGCRADPAGARRADPLGHVLSDPPRPDGQAPLRRPAAARVRRGAEGESAGRRVEILRPGESLEL